MESGGSLPYLQEPAIGPYPQPDQWSPNKFTSTSILKIY